MNYYGDLCRVVLESLNPHQFLKKGDLIYNLQPISTVSNDVLKTHTLKMAIGTKYNSSSLEDITDKVKQR